MTNLNAPLYYGFRFLMQSLLGSISMGHEQHNDSAVIPSARRRIAKAVFDRPAPFWLRFSLFGGAAIAGVLGSMCAVYGADALPRSAIEVIGYLIYGVVMGGVCGLRRG